MNSFAIAVGVAGIIFLVCMIITIFCVLYDTYGGTKFDIIAQKIGKFSLIGVIVFGIILGIFSMVCIIGLLIFQ